MNISGYRTIFPAGFKHKIPVYFQDFGEGFKIAPYLFHCVDKFHISRSCRQPSMRNQ